MMRPIELPTKHEIMRACRGGGHDGHPLLRAAFELTALHEQISRLAPDRRRGPEENRAALVVSIDHWVRARLPPAPAAAAAPPPESVGALVDRIAEYTAVAFTALTRTDDWSLWDAWNTLEELSRAYEALVVGISTGRRRLPDA
ncbi:hypothetical protein [Nocardia sp. alder85J]|uniref:hypothetical protein n=1 Tax=Nocardia sp. alder85J TaxID=2862949 RepID=UPI001CD53E26|nr:hypothetical protein [Nocardia sp. alder85J]MCX4096460.1 hypothetical protein [Nocardia sp. alder85J]